MIKLSQIAQFVALAEEGSFHRAAAVLNMAQPPLSVSIRKLEDELGALLFERGPRGVRLTAAGEVALTSARQTLQCVEEMQQSVRKAAAGELGRLRIGFVASATYEVLPRLLPAFRERFPQVELKLEEGRTAELVEKVSFGRIDVAIVRTPLVTPAHVTIDMLQKDRLVVAAAARSALAFRALVDLCDLRDEPFVAFSRERVPSMHAITMLACQSAGFLPKIAEEAGQLQTILCLVESGLGVALVPGIAASRAFNVRLIPIANPSPALEIGLSLITEADAASAVATCFRAFALECMGADRHFGDMRSIDI